MSDKNRPTASINVNTNSGVQVSDEQSSDDEAERNQDGPSETDER